MHQVLTTSNVDFVKFSGHINASSSEELQIELQQKLAKSPCSLLVADMSDVESLDSSGLMALVSALYVAQKHGKSFALAGISPSLQIIFELTKLDQAFEIRDDLLQIQAQPPIALAA